MVVQLPVVEIILGLAAFGFLCQAIEIRWHIGRLTIQPGWAALTLWGTLAALNASAEGETDVSNPSAVVLIVGALLLVSAVVTVLITQRTKHALEEIHTLVNSQSDRQVERIDQLTNTLQAAGVEVPVKKADDAR